LKNKFNTRSKKSQDIKQEMGDENSRNESSSGNNTSHSDENYDSSPNSSTNLRAKLVKLEKVVLVLKEKVKKRAG
jgi:hypothetical protein